MDETRTYTIDEAHKYFAQSINGRVWELLQKPNRTKPEDEELLHAAYACTYHWKFVGTAVHQQRGEWLISRVHVVLGNAKQALRHAERCFELTESNRELMQDFDIAYAFEGLARAHAMLGDGQMSEEFLRLAQQAAVSPMRRTSRFLWATLTLDLGLASDRSRLHAVYRNPCLTCLYPGGILAPNVPPVCH